MQDRGAGVEEKDALPQATGVIRLVAGGENVLDQRVLEKVLPQAVAKVVAKKMLEPLW